MKRLIPFSFVFFTAASPLLAHETPQAPSPIAVRLTLDDAISRARASSSRLVSLTALTRAASEGVRGYQGRCSWPGDALV